MNGVKGENASLSSSSGGGGGGGGVLSAQPLPAPIPTTNANASSISSSGGELSAQPLPAPMPTSNAPPPFLSKTYDMVDDPSTDAIVSWSPGNNSFVVWNPPEFGRDLLPKYFKHNNFSSFVRQLNTYGFRKVDPDRWEFANEGFLRGQKHLLRSIIRRKPVPGHTQQQPPQQLHGQSTSVGACVEVGKFGLEEEVERLKRDKNVLMQELVRLRQQQQATDNQLQGMTQRLQGMEQRQQQMMSFLAKAMQSPGFLAQFVQQQTESNKRITEVNKKRRLKQEDIPVSEHSAPSDGQIVKYQPQMNEATKAMLMQIMKVDPSPRLDALDSNSNDFLIGEAIDGGAPASCMSGVTLQEVSPTSGQPYIRAASRISANGLSDSLSDIQSPSLLGTSSEIVTTARLPDISALSGAQEASSISLPHSDIMMGELSEIPQMGPELAVDISNEDDVFMDPTLLGQNGSTIPLDIDDISPVPDIDALMDENSEFWEQLLLGVSDENDSTSIDDLINGNEDQQSSENGWDKVQHMDQLTEQMGLLTSDNKRV